jgi:hypothetical protein
MAAFIPGASPPLVKTAMRFMTGRIIAEKLIGDFAAFAIC